MKRSTNLTRFIFLFFIVWNSVLHAQSDTLKKYLYHPEKTVSENQDTALQDTLKRFVEDSVRMQFVRDSIMARELFVRDSIRRRQVMLDSVTWLKKELDLLLPAYFMTVEENVIFHVNPVPLVGDSALGEAVYTILPFGITDPYTPWKIKKALTGKAVSVVKNGKYITVQTPQIKASFQHAGENLLIITEQPVIEKSSSGNFYKTPVDSLYYDRYKRIAKIKRYVQYYALQNNYQPGEKLFLNCTRVIQFEYGERNDIQKMEIVNFCNRVKAYVPNKVCNIVQYSVSREGNRYSLTRLNNPSNTYSDGTFTYLFDENENLKNISFVNMAKTENWEKTIELTKEGWVSCYFDKKDGNIFQSLCMIYHSGDTKAKYPVEIITTTFEKDGISYYQRNNTTGLSRTRDKMTLEWTEWER